MRDVMIDLETLGTKPGSVFFAIGAVAFDRDSGRVFSDSGGFYRLISIADALRWGLTRDAGTIAWWSRQSPEAQAEFWRAMGGGADLSDAINDLATWLAGVARRAECSVKSLRVWGNGATFDNTLVATGCQQAQLHMPWDTFSDRCFRTLKTDNPGHEPVREGVHHHALHDAVHQAHWACAIYKAQRDRVDNLLVALGDLRCAVRDQPMSARAREGLAPAMETAWKAGEAEVSLR